MEEHTFLSAGMLLVCGEEGSIWISRTRLLLDMDCLRDRISCRRALLRMACFLMPRGCFPTDGQLKHAVWTLSTPP